MAVLRRLVHLELISENEYILAKNKIMSSYHILEEFDRVVFESIVEKVIVGETNDDGTVDPFKLTFVMKGNGNSVIPNAKDWFKAEKSTIQSA